MGPFEPLMGSPVGISLFQKYQEALPPTEINISIRGQCNETDNNEEAYTLTQAREHLDVRPVTALGPGRGYIPLSQRGADPRGNFGFMVLPAPAGALLVSGCRRHRHADDLDAVRCLSAYTSAMFPRIFINDFSHAADVVGTGSLGRRIVDAEGKERTRVRPVPRREGLAAVMAWRSLNHYSS